jgi:nucleoside-diphosphate-sugar epimerase
VQNYIMGVLRGIPGGKGRLAERLRSRGKRLPLLVPSRGNYMEHKLQFVHVDDVARLIAHIFRRRQTDPPLSIMNVAGRGDPLTMATAARIANCEIKRVPGRAACRMILRTLWNLGISDIPPEALPYLLGSYIMDTARLRVFLGDEYRKVIHYTCEEALAETFAHNPSTSSNPQPVLQTP